MEAVKLEHVSFETYIDFECSTGIKHEFHDGMLYALAGGTVEHGLISSNILADLAYQLRSQKSNCRPLNSEVKVHIEASNKYLYPDAMVICDEIEKKGKHSITNPAVIIEVLSKSTEAYDRGDKFFFYKQIPSLREYILIDQHHAQIDLYTKVSDLWKIIRIEGLEKNLTIPTLGVALSLKEIYRDVLVTDKE